MIKCWYLVLFIISGFRIFAQEEVTLSGHVLDSASHIPLVNATVSVNHRIGTSTDEQGKYSIKIRPTGADTLIVSYIGYFTAKRISSTLKGDDVVYLREEIQVLAAVVIVGEKHSARALKKNQFLIVRGDLYMQHTEVTNAHYRDFLRDIEEQQPAKLNSCEADLSHYDTAMRAYYERYMSLQTSSSKKKDGFDDYPVVNISHEAAKEYCK